VSLATYAHRHEPPAAGGPAETLLLLHGTGGNEHDLLPVGAHLAPGARLLSPRGDVLERGMARFFRRHAEGVFDLEDLRVRTDALAAWLGAAASHYGFDPARVHAVGFSNGANIAASLLLRQPGALAGAVLFRPMVPFEPGALPDLGGRRVLIAPGTQDPIAPLAQAQRLAEWFREAGAATQLAPAVAGHMLVRADLDTARAWWEGRLG
jgi:predicted esterase